MMAPPGGNPKPLQIPVDVLVPAAPASDLPSCFPAQMLPGPERWDMDEPNYVLGTVPGMSPWDNTEGTGGPFNLQVPVMQSHMRGLAGCSCNRYRPAGQTSTSQNVPLWQYALAGGVAFAAGFAAVRFAGGGKKKKRRK